MAFEAAGRLKILVQSALVIEVEEDALPELSAALEEQMRDNILAAIEKHDLTDEQIQEIRDNLLNFGCSISLLREPVI